MILSFCDDHFIIISYSIKISSHTSHHQALAWHYCHYLSLSSSQIISSQKITFDTLGQLSHTFVIPNLIPWCVFPLSGHFAYWQYFAHSIHCNVNIGFRGDVLDFECNFSVSTVHCSVHWSLTQINVWRTSPGEEVLTWSLLRHWWATPRPNWVIQPPIGKRRRQKCFWTRYLYEPEEPAAFARCASHHACLLLLFYFRAVCLSPHNGLSVASLACLLDLSPEEPIGKGTLIIGWHWQSTFSSPS